MCPNYVIFSSFHGPWVMHMKVISIHLIWGDVTKKIILAKAVRIWSGGFLPIFTAAFLLFLAPLGCSNSAGPIFLPWPEITHHPYTVYVKIRRNLQLQILPLTNKNYWIYLLSEDKQTEPKWNNFSLEHKHAPCLSLYFNI